MAKTNKTEVTSTRYSVTSIFKDAATFVAEGAKPQTYKPGTDVSHFDEDRLKDLVKRGLVTKEEITAADAGGDAE